MVFLENTTPRISRFYITLENTTPRISLCLYDHRSAASRIRLLTNIYILLMMVPLVPHSRLTTNIKIFVWCFSRTPLLVYHFFYMILDNFYRMFRSVPVRIIIVWLHACGFLLTLMTVLRVSRSRFHTNMETSVWCFWRTPLLVYHFRSVHVRIIIVRFHACGFILTSTYC